MQQPLAAKTVGRSPGLPVLHLPQLVGLAFWLTSDELGMARHIVKATRVIDWSQAVIAAAT
jgi:succinate dehydrogenase / fumarate reductase, cytochrome b subunit